MNILGISCYYHDSAACLVIDGTVVAAAAEERFSRVKHDNNFPENAIRFCLSWANLHPTDLDMVVFYEKPIVKFDRMLRQHFAHFPTSRKVFVEIIGSWFEVKLQIPKTLKKTFRYKGPVHYLPHHFSHAASAYYLSGFDKAAIVTIDGVGEWATTTIGLGKNDKITIDKEIRFPHSLGLLYSAMTSYLGFEVNDAEYKVMGLAAYGDPKPFRKQMDELVRVFPDGSYALNLKYFDYVRTDRMFNKHLEELFGHSARNAESPMEHSYENIAASLQEKLENTVFHLLTVVHKRYKTDNLCLAGGVALNSVMNGKILKNTPFKNIFIPPDPGDGGGAMGAALAMSHSNVKSFSPYLGPSFPDEQIEDVLLRNGLLYERLDRAVLVDRVADLLSQEKIVGWFQGRMEWGPRALGNRSILASAARVEMRDIINSKVKHRELFRPFAPVILAQHVKDYFITDFPVPTSATAGSASQPAAQVQSGASYVTFSGVVGGTYTVSPTVPSTYVLTRACWSRTLNAPTSGEGLSSSLSVPTDSETLTWDLGYRLGVPWVQTGGGDVYAAGIMSSYIPSGTTPRAFSLDGAGGLPGVAIYGTSYDFDSDPTLTGGTFVSSYDWLVNETHSPVVNYYEYFRIKLGGPITPSTVQEMGSSQESMSKPPSRATPYYVVGDMTTSGDWAVADGETVIFIVNGNLTLGGKVNITGSGFAAFIVNGNISVSSSVGGLSTSSTPVIEGIYVTNPTGSFQTGTSTVVGKERFVGQGMFMAGSFLLERDLDSVNANTTTASELFLYNPRLLFSMPDSMKDVPIYWQEVAP